MDRFRWRPVLRPPSHSLHFGAEGPPDFHAPRQARSGRGGPPAGISTGSLQTRHLAPQPKTALHSVRTGLDGVIDSLIAAQHRLEMFPVHSQMVTLATASTGFRTPSRKSSPKLVNSSRPDPGQRLAGQVAIPYSSHGPPEPVGLLRVARQSGRVQRRPPLPKRDGLEHMLRSSGRLRHRYLQDGC
jgi:hypothetical protein